MIFETTAVAPSSWVRTESEVIPIGFEGKASYILWGDESTWNAWNRWLITEVATAAENSEDLSDDMVQALLNAQKFSSYAIELQAQWLNRFVSG